MDVSRTGARLSAPDLPSEGQDLVFRADNVEAFGKVVWSRGNECGIAFGTPLTSTDVERLRRAADLPLCPGLSIQDDAAWSSAASG
jgi:PilZ domain